MKYLLLLLSALSLTAFANDDTKVVAILPTVDVEGDVAYGVKFQLRANLTYAINMTPGYMGVDRVDMSSIMNEQSFQRTGAVNNDQIKKLGVMAGAQYVLIAEAALYDEQNIIIAAKILDVETGGLVNSSPPSIASKDPEKMQTACMKVAKTLLGVSGSIGSPVKDGGSSNSLGSVGSGYDYTETACDINMKMIWVEGGDFLMGCTSEQSDCDDDEKNVRRVTVDGFYIGMLEVTQAQWEKVIKKDVNSLYLDKKDGCVIVDEESGDTTTCPFWIWQEMNSTGKSYPMYHVDWYEAMEFCRILSNKSGRKYTLPTEAQWEYAARGGVMTSGQKYSGSNNIEDVAWYSNNSVCHCIWGKELKRGGTLKPNELGLYDMSGSVSEWCRDIYSDPYISYDTNNPTGPKEENADSFDYMQVLRGGDFKSDANRCRISARGAAVSAYFDDCIGFRVVCEPFRKSGVDTTPQSGYVDMGLPSGTLWKAENENCGFITYDEATTTYESNLPTREQWEELKYSCIWYWIGNGYKVTGPSGASIYLPAEGYRDCNGNTNKAGEEGHYWTSTFFEDYNGAVKLHFDSDDQYDNSIISRCNCLSIRLVK